MNKTRILELFDLIKENRITKEEFLEELIRLPFEQVGRHHCIDVHRHLRRGIPEVIYGEGKSKKDLLELCENYLSREVTLLVTRVDPHKAKSIKRRFPNIRYNRVAKCLYFIPEGVSKLDFDGSVYIVTAGSSDLPVGEEARITLKLIGCPYEIIHDVGAAGIHRLLPHLPKIRKARAIIVIAGMDGVLPTVVSSLVSSLVIAVPTSVGYGVNFAGVSPLLTMLNSCSPGVCVVNINNGFGAAVCASYVCMKR